MLITSAQDLQRNHALSVAFQLLLSCLLGSPCGMELYLRPTVSRPVCLGVGPPIGAHDQILHVL
jgi:hypothetical protein